VTRFLLDQGLPRGTALLLRNAGFDTQHTGECGLATAADATILNTARKEARVVVTLDADFHTLLAVQGLSSPSVIRVRREGLQADAMAALIVEVCAQVAEDLVVGAMVTVDAKSVRVHHLASLARDKVTGA
jgi:predicted nuclease of predicted toxin-antitoxin system